GNRAVAAMLQRQVAVTPSGSRKLARELQGEVNETPEHPSEGIEENADIDTEEAEEEEGETERVLSTSLARTPAEHSPSSRKLQRHSITSGWFKKKVKFKLDDLSATLPGGLNVQPSAGGLKVGSNPYRATGTVTAKGADAEIAKYELGFVQTLFRSSVRFSY